MTFARRPALIVGIGVLVLGWMTSACSRAGGGESGAVGTSGQVSPITIETSSQFVTIANRATSTLIDLGVAITPIGGAAPFTSLVSRLEPGEQKRIAISDFHTSDGKPLNRLFIQPKNVIVKAADLIGHKYEETVAWR